MLQRQSTCLPALVLAVLMILGTIGIYSTEASAFRSTVRETQVFDESANVQAVEYPASGSPYTLVPGLPY
jgi:hypothetical protein